MTDLIKQITSDLEKQIQSFEPQISVSDIGTVVEAGDGIARVQGLANVESQELVEFAKEVTVARLLRFFSPERPSPRPRNNRRPQPRLHRSPWTATPCVLPMAISL